MDGNHLSTPVPLPDISHLTHEELSALRAYLTARKKDARSDANKVFGKYPKVRDLWLKTLSLKSDATPEERTAVETTFHQEILRHPEAFMLYAWANALSTLDRYIWETMLANSKSANVKKSGASK